MPVREISDAELVRRAVRNARPHRRGKSPRWVAVMDTFALGSTYAGELCQIHELDPEEIVRGPNCDSARD